MLIRNATYYDAPAIKLLMEALGYKSSISLLISQLENLFAGKDHQVFVYETNKEVLGFIAIHYLPQLGFDGGLVLITCLSVEEMTKNQVIAKALEQYITDQAKKRKCERIQAYCLDRLTPTQQFYLQQGYQEGPKFYTKRLMYGE